MKYHNPKWFKFEGTLSVLILLAALAWLAVPTRLLYNPSSVLIDGYQVTVYRTFPLSPPFRMPIIRYAETVRPVIGPMVCHDPNGSTGFRYRDNGQPAAQWDIKQWAAPCMKGAYVWSARWTALLFGVIPLRPVELTTVIEPTQ